MMPPWWRDITPLISHPLGHIVSGLGRNKNPLTNQRIPKFSCFTGDFMLRPLQHRVAVAPPPASKKWQKNASDFWKTTPSWKCTTVWWYTPPRMLARHHQDDGILTDSFGHKSPTPLATWPWAAPRHAALARAPRHCACSVARAWRGCELRKLGWNVSTFGKHIFDGSEIPNNHLGCSKPCK